MIKEFTKKQTLGELEQFLVDKDAYIESIQLREGGSVILNYQLNKKDLHEKWRLHINEF